MTVKYKKVTKDLDKWLEQCNDTDFPFGHGVNYKSQFVQISQYLAKDYHNEVEKGAIIAALKDKNCELEQVPYLNNHGKDHVQVVTRKATELLQKANCVISPYEGYLLLLAIQFHDIGNIFGRSDHETKCRDIMRNLGKIAGSDEPEKRIITNIASAHGGLLLGGGKDTIGELETEQDLMGQKVRARMLAAILRFADELADDSSRVSSAILELDVLPEESRIYHLYSLSLHSVMIEEKEIRLRFEFGVEHATNEYAKNNGTKVYLLDEIYIRTLKMYKEMLYCMRFLRPHFKLDRIQTEIKVFPPTMKPGDPLRITYTLEERGYPDYYGNIFSICEDLKKQTGVLMRKRITSEWGV